MQGNTLRDMGMEEQRLVQQWSEDSPEISVWLPVSWLVRMQLDTCEQEDTMDATAVAMAKEER